MKLTREYVDTIQEEVVTVEAADLRALLARLEDAERTVARLRRDYGELMRACERVVNP